MLYQIYVSIRIVESQREAIIILTQGKNNRKTEEPNYWYIAHSGRAEKFYICKKNPAAQQGSFTRNLSLDLLLDHRTVNNQ